MAHLNLGLSLSSLGRQSDALSVHRRAALIEDDGTKDPRTHAAARSSAKINCGRILLDMGRADDAMSVLKEAEEEMKQQQQQKQQRQVLMNLLGEACQALNQTEMAERWYRRAASHDHVPAYLKYGKLLARNVSLRRYISTFMPYSTVLSGSTHCSPFFSVSWLAHCPRS